VIHVGDHGGEGGFWFPLVGVVRMWLVGEKFLFEDRSVFFLPLFFGAEAGVRDLEGEVEEEGAVFLSVEVSHRFCHDDIGRVVIAFMQGVLGIADLVAVFPEVVGVVKVGGSVGGESEEVVESFGVYEGGVIGVAAETGLADEGGMVAGFLKSGGENGIVRVLAHLELTISANVDVAGVLTFKKGATTRSADGGARVVSSETQTFGSHAIEVRSLDNLLAIAAEVAVSEVIGEDVDHVGLLCREERAGGEKEKRERELFHGRSASLGKLGSP
jgi:hypothetical protein